MSSLIRENKSRQEQEGPGNTAWIRVNFTRHSFLKDDQANVSLGFLDLGESKARIRKGITVFFSRFLWSVLFGSALIFSGCLLASVSENQPVENGELSARLETYKSRLELLRGLKFKRPTPLAVIDREVYRKQLEAEIDGDISDSISKEITLELIQLGFFANDSTQYKSFAKKTFGGFPAGYYVPGTDSVYVLSEYANNNTQLEHILPHELIHALQDQNFESFRKKQIGNPAYLEAERRGFATQVIEGDAYYCDVLHDATYISKVPDPETATWQAVHDRRGLGYQRWIAQRPPATLFTANFSPYEIGPAFIADTKKASGLKGVNELYTQSQRYAIDAFVGSVITPVTHDFTPVLVLADTLDHFTDASLFGAEQLMALLGPKLSLEDYDSALGWRGDRYVYVHPPTKPFGILTAAFSFSSEKWSHRVFSLLKDHLIGRGISGIKMKDAGSHATRASFDSSTAFEAPGYYGILGCIKNDCYWVENEESRIDGFIAAAKQSRALAKAGSRSQGGQPSPSILWNRWPKNHQSVPPKND